MKAPPLSTRGHDAPASPIRKLAPLATAARVRGVTVHPLNIGQPDIPTPEVMLAAYRAYHEPVIAYAPSDGYAWYRERLAAYYTALAAEGGGRSVDADDIIVTVGGSEALLFAIAAICDPGDDVLVCEPYYTNYAGFAHMLGVAVRPVRTLASEGFRVDLARVEASIGPRTRALLVTTPGNPTGVILSRGELHALAELCVRRGLFFVCDEVYRDFVYDGPEGARAPSALSLPGFESHVVVIDSVSKRYSACGTRIGALVTHNAALRAAALCFGQARLSPATVDQYAASAALDTPASYFREVVTEYRARRDVLVDGLRAAGIACARPEGAFYLVAPLPGVTDADDFCRFLLDDFALDGETVMLAPASGFYATPGLGHDEVRLAYVIDRPRLVRSAHILGVALDVYRRAHA